MMKSEFEKLVEEHKALIYSVCYMFAKDADGAADLFQEVLIRLWRGFGSYNRRSSERTWIYRVALNACINEGRRRRLDTVPLDLSLDFYEDDDDSSRQAQALYERIHKLNIFDRAIVLMWLEGLPYQEIADVVGISVNNVGVRLNRIRETLKKQKDND